MSDAKIIAAARRLGEFLEDPVVVAAYKTAAEDIFRRFCAPGHSDAELRAIYGEAQGLGRIQQAFRAVIGQGEAASAQLEAEKKKEKEQARP